MINELDMQWIEEELNGTLNITLELILEEHAWHNGLDYEDVGEWFLENYDVVLHVLKR
jgi:hypothetical protein